MPDLELPPLKTRWVAALQTIRSANVRFLQNVNHCCVHCARVDLFDDIVNAEPPQDYAFTSCMNDDRYCWVENNIFYSRGVTTRSPKPVMQLEVYWGGSERVVPILETSFLQQNFLVHKHREDYRMMTVRFSV